MMNHISIEEARSEAVGSLQDLKREIGEATPVFAYPGGQFSTEIACMLKQEGFELAFTTTPGMNIIDDMDWLEIRRLNIGKRTTITILRARLLTYYNYLCRCYYHMCIFIIAYTVCSLSDALYS